MATFLLDSTVLIDYLRGQQEVVTRVQKLAREGHHLGLCAINVAEVFAGMLEHERPVTERLLGWLDFLDISYETAQAGGELQADLRRQNSPAELPDALIGATALAHGATLLTRNVKDFAMPGLQLERLPAETEDVTGA